MHPIRTEVPFSTPWFQVVAKTLKEEEGPWYSLRLPDYAAIVAVTDDGRIVLVRQYRPAVEKVTLELPSGLIDAGESPAEAAGRELREETGYDAEVELLGPLLPDTGRLGNRIWCCVARNLRPAEGWAPEAGVETELMTLAELEAATADGRFDHALHLAALLLAQVRGKFAFR
jgi:ADP-ribose pyrophosphatase